MEFFSNSKPNLINNQIDNKIKKYMIISQINNRTFSESIMHFYDVYLKHNMFSLIVILVVCFFLYIRFNIKKMNDEKKNIIKKHKNKTKKEHTIISNIDQSIYDIDTHNDEDVESEKIIETRKIVNDILDGY